MDYLPEHPAPELKTVQGQAGLLRVGITRAQGTRRGVILILNGRAEFIEKYRPSLGILAEWGYDSIILDWRGQGGSWRDRRHYYKGHVDDFKEYLDDLDLVLSWLRVSAFPSIDVVIGHSMGGHLVLRALVERGLSAKTAVFIAPMFDIALELPRWLVRGVAAAGSRLGLRRAYAPGQHEYPPATRRFENNPLTSDPELFETYRQLLIHHDAFRVGGVTYGWLRAALRSIAITWTSDYAEKLRIPSLVLTGSEDRVVSNAAAQRMAARMTAGRYLTFEGARHDLLWERPTVRERLWREIRGVLDYVEATQDSSLLRERAHS